MAISFNLDEQNALPRCHTRPNLTMRIRPDAPDELSLRRAFECACKIDA